MADNWKYLPVNKGKDKAKVDTEDFTKLSKLSWRTVTSVSGRGVVVTSVQTPKGVRMVTLGAYLMKPPKGKQVYPRRFQNGFDYRKENLIVCTMKERQRILPKNRNHIGTSQYKGVSFYSRTKTWRAGIGVDGKSIHIGFYDSEDEAAIAYNKAAIEHFGHQAYQNQVKKRPLRRNRED